MSFLGSYPTNPKLYSSSYYVSSKAIKISFEHGHLVEAISNKQFGTSMIGHGLYITGRGVFDIVVGQEIFNFILIPTSYTGSRLEQILKHMKESDFGTYSDVVLKVMKILVKALRQELKKIARFVGTSVEDLQVLVQTAPHERSVVVHRSGLLRYVKYGDPVYHTDVTELQDMVLRLINVVKALITMYMMRKLPVPQEALNYLYLAETLVYTIH